MSCVSGKSYTVKKGDTPSIIALQQLGDGNRWREIKKTDGTPLTEADETKLQEWQELCIPDGFTGIVPPATFEAMFPNRDGFYSYDCLVAATQKYPSFCNEGSDEQCRREAAAFLANVAHETEVAPQNWTGN